MNCKNCNQTANGKFCMHCGQSTKVDKINFSNFLSDLSSSIFQVNKGFFYTLKELFIRPGHSIREYLTGKRKNHFKPIAYAFTLSTIYFLLSQFLETGTFVSDIIQGISHYNDEVGKENKAVATLKWVTQNHAYNMLMLLPVYTLASYLAFFKSGFNYLEHFVLNAYILGQQAILYSFSLILIPITKNEDLFVSVSLFFSISYAIFVFRQFFSKQSRVSVFFRSILVYILYIILSIAFLLISLRIALI